MLPLRKVYYPLSIINYPLSPRLARFLSALLHPLLMPTLLFAVIFYRAPDVVHNLQFVNAEASVAFGPLRLSFATGLLFLLFMWTFLVPVLLIYWLYRLGFVQSLTLETRRERHLPYLITAVIYTALSVFFAYRLAQLPEIALVLGAIAATVALVSGINLTYQISAHAAGMGGVVGALAGLMLRLNELDLFAPLVGTIVLAGLLLSARLRLNAHTPGQVASGLALGLAVSVATVLFLG
jgi:hypothetical protein